MVELLLRHGANPNFKYVEKWSIVHEAAEKGTQIKDKNSKYQMRIIF